MDLEKWKRISPWWTVGWITIAYVIIVFFARNPRSLYGDFGLMYLQVHDLIESDYSSFSAA